jgi:hypothetical protein
MHLVEITPLSRLMQYHHLLFLVLPSPLVIAPFNVESYLAFDENNLKQTKITINIKSRVIYGSISKL